MGSTNASPRRRLIAPRFVCGRNLNCNGLTCLTGLIWRASLTWYAWCRAYLLGLIRVRLGILRPTQLLQDLAVGPVQIVQEVQQQASFGVVHLAQQHIFNLAKGQQVAHIVWAQVDQVQFQGPRLDRCAAQDQEIV